MATAVPMYGRRGKVLESGDSRAWRPSEARDFGASGGAFPECAVVQFPHGMGWDHGDGDASAPVTLGVDFETLCGAAAAKAFAERRSTPEYDGFLRHVDRCAEIVGEHGDWTRVASTGGALRGAMAVRRVSGIDPNTVEASFLLGEGEPVVVEDGGRNWASWTMDDFKLELDSFFVRCNDRAPARRSEEGPMQRTHQLAFRDYVDYVHKRDGDGCSPRRFDRERVPFYANGLRAFSESDSAETLAKAFPRPYFARECDQTEALVASITSELGKRLRFDEHISETLAKGVSKSLDKVFCGPRGAITRLHFDAGDAHGYLGQVVGRKLFVFFPPSDGDKLGVIQNDPTHGLIDPLDPDFERFPRFCDAQPHACILAPGEVVLNPRRWWHYAVSLDSSVTVMRNFYTANTNAEALVEMLVSSAAGTIKDSSGQLAPRTATL